MRTRDFSAENPPLHLGDELHRPTLVAAGTLLRPPTAKGRKIWVAGEGIGGVARGVVVASVVTAAGWDRMLELSETRVSCGLCLTRKRDQSTSRIDQRRRRP